MTIKQVLAPAEEEQVREVQRQYHAKYYLDNKKRIIESSTRWNKENPEKRKDINRKYYERKKANETQL